jgi:hypothetical protein
LIYARSTRSPKETCSMKQWQTTKSKLPLKITLVLLHPLFLDRRHHQSQSNKRPQNP